MIGTEHDVAGERADATLDEEALTAWGRRVGAAVLPPIVIALRGPLGAGKSVLARAIGRGAGIEGPMPSPTFNLLFRYELPRGGSLAHLDLYRLGDPDEVWELGWSELGAEGEVVLIEWPERAGDLMPSDHWLVELSIVPEHPSVRAVRARAMGTPPPLPDLPDSTAARST